MRGNYGVQLESRLPLSVFFSVKAMFSTLETFWQTQTKAGVPSFQSALSKGNPVGCGHLKHKVCVWFHSQLLGTERGHK